MSNTWTFLLEWLIRREQHVRKRRGEEWEKHCTMVQGTGTSTSFGCWFFEESGHSITAILLLFDITFIVVVICTLHLLHPLRSQNEVTKSGSGHEWGLPCWLHRRRPYGSLSPSVDHECWSLSLQHVPWTPPLQPPFSCAFLGLCSSGRGWGPVWGYCPPFLWNLLSTQLDLPCYYCCCWFMPCPVWGKIWL